MPYDPFAPPRYRTRNTGPQAPAAKPWRSQEYWDRSPGGSLYVPEAQNPLGPPATREIPGAPRDPNAPSRGGSGPFIPTDEPWGGMGPFNPNENAGYEPQKPSDAFVYSPALYGQGSALQNVSTQPQRAPMTWADFVSRVLASDIFGQR